MKSNQNCRIIGNLLYLTDDEMNPDEKLLLSRHIEFCSSCMELRFDFLAARAKTVQLKNQLPECPEITRSVMLLIGSDAAAARGKAGNSSTWAKTIRLAQLVSGIAATFLFFLFLSEQTDAVRKISLLENRIQSTVIPADYGLIDRITMARATLSDRQIKSLAERLNIDTSVSNERDLLLVRKNIENRIQQMKKNDLSLIGLYRKSFLLKRNSATIKKLIK